MVYVLYYMHIIYHTSILKIKFTQEKFDRKISLWKANKLVLEIAACGQRLSYVFHAHEGKKDALHIIEFRNAKNIIKIIEIYI